MKKNIWNKAATSGLVLGLASTVFMFLSQYISTGISSAGTSFVLTSLLWIAKIGGCAWLMYFFIKKFATEYKTENSAAFKMGTATALLSAFVFAAASYANVAYISADIYAEQMQTLMQQMGSAMDSNTKMMMEKMFTRMPEITFFSNLIYCFIYGTVLSLIISKSIENKDPFADFKPEEE